MSGDSNQSQLWAALEYGFENAPWPGRMDGQRITNCKVFA